MDNEVAIDVLKLLLEACPDSISVQTSPDLDDGDLPLHKAARVKSKAFCKVLVDAYPESVRRENGYGALPFHHACKNGCPDTVEYLFKLHPESLHIRSDGGCLPIHWASDKTGENTAGMSISYSFRILIAYQNPVVLGICLFILFAQDGIHRM